MYIVSDFSAFATPNRKIIPLALKTVQQIAPDAIFASLGLSDKKQIHGDRGKGRRRQIGIFVEPKWTYMGAHPSGLRGYFLSTVAAAMEHGHPRRVQRNTMNRNLNYSATKTLFWA